MTILSSLGIDGVLSLPLISIYLLYAIGIVVIYRASRVLNLAHGVMAMIPAYVFYALGQHMPAWPAFFLAVLSGIALGVGTERLVVNRLRPQGPTAQTVGTVAVFGLGIAAVSKVFGTAPLVTQSLFPKGAVAVGFTGLSYGQIIVFVAGLVIAGAMFALFRFTDIGLAMRGSADNRRGALLMGVNVELTTMVAWGLGGGLAAVAGIFVGSLTNIHPYTLSLQVLPAFVAALVGGLDSLSGTAIGAAVVGLAQGEVPAMRLIPVVGPVASAVGFSDLFLMVVAFVVMALRGARLVGSKVRDEAIGAASAVVGGARRSAALGPAALLAAIVVVILPFMPFLPFSILTDATLAAFYLVVALSIVLLTGWVGQISLAQAEFVGVGAFFTSVLANRFHIGFPWSFFLAVVGAGLVAGALGLVALRVRGLYLAVATLVFAAMADNFLFNADWFGVIGGSASVRLGILGDPKALPRFDLNDVHFVYLVFIAFAGFCLYALAHLKDSKTGRAFFAVRGSEVAAASLGIDVTRYKLLAFLLSGMMAGAAGNLYIVYLRSVVPDSFNVLASLLFLSIAVVGGLLSPGGAIVAAIIFAALQELFFRVGALAGLLDVVSSGLLLAVLLTYPGGLAALPARLRVVADMAEARVARASKRVGLQRLKPPLPRLPVKLPQVRLPKLMTRAAGAERRDALDSLARPAVAAETTTPEPSVTADAGLGAAALTSAPWEGFVVQRDHESPREGEKVLECIDIVVRFGGLTAVNGVNLEVREGEIVGLIGANGAGKTTMFNVISGLIIPTEGQVKLFGRRASHLDVHQRAAKGLARTFQDIQLFPQLTVFDNLLVATHLHNSSTVAEHMVVTGRALREERAARARVRKVLTFLEMVELGPRPIKDLSFGLLRMVEVARALVTGATMILLDEPASGLDNVESDRLVDLLLYVREMLKVTMLVVEHDVRAVVRLSDYMYVLDQGRLISHGRPRAVQSDERVIAAYLGSTGDQTGTTRTAEPVEVLA